MIQDFVSWWLNTSNYFYQKHIKVNQTAAFPYNHYAVNARTEVGGPVQNNIEFVADF